MHSALHPSVAARLARYRALMERHGSVPLDGLYLVGSIALDDFQPGWSDIDFIAVTAEPLSSNALDVIETVHRTLAREPGPALDGFYLDRSRLGLPPDPAATLPFELAGHFHRRTACFEANPVTWATWHDHGVPILGPPPKDLGLSIDPAALIEFERDNLDRYWIDWVVSRWAGPADSMVASWGVLGVLRLAHVLATGAVASKTAAGHWALSRFARSWRPIVEEALETRRGGPVPMPLARYHTAVDFVAFVIAETRSGHPLR